MPSVQACSSARNSHWPCLTFIEGTTVATLHASARRFNLIVPAASRTRVYAGCIRSTFQRCNMKPSDILKVATMALAVLVSVDIAMAQDAGPPPPRPLPAAKPRAEVQAELQIYRESGLFELERVPDAVDYSSRAYLRAKDRYAQLRESPYFATLVKRYAERHGDDAKLAAH